MLNATVLTDRFDRALLYATHVHGGQVRKGTSAPYCGGPRLSDIRNRFGDRVADIVRSCSDSVVNTSAGQQKEDKRIRTTRYIEHLETVDKDTLLISLSDKVHNARSILRDLRKPEVGTTAWERSPRTFARVD